MYQKNTNQKKMISANENFKTKNIFQKERHFIMIK